MNFCYLLLPTQLTHLLTYPRKKIRFSLTFMIFPFPLVICLCLSLSIRLWLAGSIYLHGVFVLGSGRMGRVISMARHGTVWFDLISLYSVFIAFVLFCFFLFFFPLFTFHVSSYDCHHDARGRVGLFEYIVGMNNEIYESFIFGLLRSISGSTESVLF